MLFLLVLNRSINLKLLLITFSNFNKLVTYTTSNFIHLYDSFYLVPFYHPFLFLRINSVEIVLRV